MALKIGYAARPIPGETHCGDQAGWWQSSDRLVLALADGLGHGKPAEEAARKAMTVLAETPHSPIEQLFETCNRSLQATRGAALAVAAVALSSHQVTVATVGNVRCALLRRTKDRMVGGARGIVGAGYAYLAPETFELAPGDTIVLFSDGMDEQVGLREMLDAEEDDIEEMARHILAEFARSNDDAAVLVYRHCPDQAEAPE